MLVSGEMRRREEGQTGEKSGKKRSNWELADLEGLVLGLDTSEFPNKVLDLAHGLGVVPLLVFSVNPLGRFVEQRTDSRKVAVAKLKKKKVVMMSTKGRCGIVECKTHTSR